MVKYGVQVFHCSKVLLDTLLTKGERGVKIFNKRSRSLLQKVTCLNYTNGFIAFSKKDKPSQTHILPLHHSKGAVFGKFIGSECYKINVVTEMIYAALRH